MRFGRARVWQFIVGVLVIVVASLVVVSQVGSDDDLAVGVEGEGGDDGGGDGGGGEGDGAGELPGGSGDEPGGGGSSGDDGNGAPGGGAGPGDGGSDGGGSSDGAGSEGGSGSGGPGGGDAPTPPGSPSVCGPEEWFGPLKNFIRKLGNPVPGPLQRAVDESARWADTDLFGASALGPIASVPGAVLQGFQQAYKPLADALPGGGCPGVSGDPHVHTIDGAGYDFQSVGEYMALRSDSGDLEVQVRLAPAGESGLVSRVRGVAIRVGEHTLTIDHTPDAVVTLDGVPFEAPGVMATEDGAYLLRDETVVGVFWPDIYTSISVTGIGSSFVNLYATLDAARSGAVAGLLGDADGDKTNDLVLPDGTEVDDDFAVVHGEFRDAWRVSEDDSLFTGPSLFDATYPGARAALTNSQKKEAQSLCLAAGVLVARLLENCTIDVALTGDTSYAERYGAEQRERLLIEPGCEGEVGEVQSAPGLGPGRTFFAGGGVIDGEPAWELVLESGQPAQVRGVATMDDGLFVVDARNGFHFVDSDGAVIRTLEAVPITHVPVVTSKREFAITEESLLSLNRDGTACWQLVGYDDEVFETVTYGAELLFATTRLEGIGTVMAIDAETGAILWSRSFGAQVGAVAVGAEVVVASAAKTTMALNTATGVERWATESGFSVSAVAVFDGTAYVLDLNTGLVALDLDTGEMKWNFDDKRGGFMTNLAVGPSRIVVVNARFARGLDPADGRLAWTLGEDERTRFYQPVIADDVVYFFAANRGLVGHDVDTGAERLRVDTPGARVQGSLLPFGDMVVFFDATGALKAYR